VAFLPHEIASLLIVVFTVLGLWHLYWAFGGSFLKSAAIPSTENSDSSAPDDPVFEPGPRLTALVGLAILTMTIPVAGAGRLIPSPIPAAILPWMCFGLAAIFLFRAIGDFKYVGFFKRVKSSSFSRYDTFVYSPLCCFLALGLALLGRSAL